MPRALLSIALLAQLALATPSLAAEGYSVTIDQSSHITIPAGARDILIGNPAIADVSVIDNRNLVLLGRGYGVTNLLVLDGRGRTLVDRQVVVSAPDAGQVRFVRGGKGGAEMATYACAPACQRTPMPGEPNESFNDYAGPYTAYATRGKSAGTPTTVVTGP
jgi:hypothetical protein